MKTSVIIHGLHNEFTLDQMKACIELAEKYGGSFRHVVTGLQITGIEKDDIKVAFLRHATSKIKTALDLISVSSLELPEGVTTVVHRGVNSLIACVGKGYCKNGQMETKELADYVERKHYGRKTSHKCKIGISGCGRNCPDAMVKDIAFIGTSQGYMLAVGGNTGIKPEAGTILARNLTVEQAKKAVDILVDWYAEHGEPRERMGKLLARLGNPLEGMEL